VLACTLFVRQLRHNAASNKIRFIGFFLCFALAGLGEESTRLQININGETTMATAAFQKFNCFVEDLAEKKHDLGADALKVMLTATAPVATNTVRSNITDLSTANGYTNGGAAATLGSSTQTSGTYKLVLNDVTFTATGAVGPFRYAVLYNTVGTAPLIGWWDNGTNVTLANTEVFTIDYDALQGVLTIT
jgi:hypothetical protein